MNSFNIETLSNIVTIITPFLPIAVGGYGIATGAGMFARIGPGRALWIALRSRFRPNKLPLSIRENEVSSIRRSISGKMNQNYLVVVGEKGVGKTCLVNSVTNKMAGVIEVEAKAGSDQNEILDNVFTALTRLNRKALFVDPEANARRVVFWYSIWTLGKAPVVVLTAKERTTGKPYADLTGAVTTLVNKYKLNVIIDGSPNAVDPSLFRTERQLVRVIEPMSKDEIWKLPQLEDMLDYVDKAGLSEVLYEVLGGVPARYERLWKNLRDAKIEEMDKQDARLLIENRLLNEIGEAIKVVQNAREEKNSDMKGIIQLFDQEKMMIVRDMLEKKNLQRSSPDKIFREAKINGENVLIPASNAIGIVLRHGLVKEPSIEQLIEMSKTLQFNQ